MKIRLTSTKTIKQNTKKAIKTFQENKEKRLPTLHIMKLGGGFKTSMANEKINKNLTKLVTKLKNLNINIKKEKGVIKQSMLFDKLTTENHINMLITENLFDNLRRAFTPESTFSQGVYSRKIQMSNAEISHLETLTKDIYKKLQRLSVEKSNKIIKDMTSRLEKTVNTHITNEKYDTKLYDKLYEQLYFGIVSKYKLE